MNKFIFFSLFLFFFVISACVKYTPPPSIIHSDNYTAALDSEKRTLPEYNHIFTIDDAIRIGLANNPSFEKQKLALESAYNTYYNAIVNYLPNISASTNIGAGQTQSQSPAFSGGWTKTPWLFPSGASATSNFTIFNGLRREFNLLKQSANVLKEEELVQNSRRILVNTIITAYYDIVQTKAQIKVTEMDLSFQKNLRKFEMAKFQQNLITEESVLNFEYYSFQDESTILKLELTYKQQTYILASLLGLTSADLPKDIKLLSLSELVESINIDFNPIGVEYYLDLAVDQRPDLKALREALRMSKYDLYSVWGSFAPTITAQSGYNWGTNLGGGPSSNGVNYGVNADWVIWDNGQRIFNLRAAQIDYDQSSQDLLIGWIAIIQDVRYAYDALLLGLENYRVLQKAVDIAEKQRKMVQALYETDMVTLPRLNEAQNNLYEAQFNLAIATVAIYQAKSNLDNSVGVARY